MQSAAAAEITRPSLAPTSPFGRAVAGSQAAKTEHENRLAHQQAWFGPDWIICPCCYAGVHRSDLRPCSCGAQVLVIVANDKAAVRCREICKRCADTHKLWKPGDVVLGQLDVVKAVFTFTR